MHKDLDYHQRILAIKPAVASLLRQYSPPGYLDEIARKDFLNDMTQALNSVIPRDRNKESMDLALSKIRRAVVEHHKYQRWPSDAEVCDWSRPEMAIFHKPDDGIAGGGPRLKSIPPVTGDQIAKNNAWLESEPRTGLKTMLRNLRETMRAKGVDV